MSCRTCKHCFEIIKLDKYRYDVKCDLCEEHLSLDRYEIVMKCDEWEGVE